MRTTNSDMVAALAVQGLHGGVGQIRGGTVLDAAELGGGAWRFVDAWILPPGTSIGSHRHERGRELYLVLSGRGTMTTNGVPAAVGPGDLVLNEPGDTHALENTGREELRVLVTAVIED